MIGEILSLILPLNPDENSCKSETSAGFGRYLAIDTRKVAVVVKIEIRGYISLPISSFSFSVLSLITVSVQPAISRHIAAKSSGTASAFVFLFGALLFGN